jgi:hypothetical protein
MGEIFTAAGSIASASIAANAQEEATKMQIDALQKQRDFVYNQLDPSVVGGAAKAADVQRAKDRLALQATVDPELLNQRYASEKSITKQLQDLTSGTSNSQKVADRATAEALAPDALAPGKKALIDAALQEIQAGATLPPDIQNELMQSGLEKSGSVTGGPGGTGFGQQILRTVVGNAGLQLRQQRLEQAKGLLGQAQNLEASRAQILGTLFPNLNTVAQNNLKATSGVLDQSNKMVPEAGLGGSDIANIWLARVGATNQLAQSAADAAARGATASAQTWNNGMGQAIGYGAKALPSTSDFFKNTFSNSGGGSPSDADISDFVNLGII